MISEAGEEPTGEVRKQMPVLEITAKDIGPVIEITRADVGLPRDISEEISIDAPTRTEDPGVKDQKARERFLKDEFNKITEQYAKAKIVSPIDMPSHFQQEEKGQNGLYTCVAASCRNALYALGAEKPYSDDEKSIVEAMGGTAAFDRSGFITNTAAIKFLRSRELEANETPSFIDVINAVRSGGVAIVSYGAHARLISGVEGNGNGQLLFRVNNPYRERAEKVNVNDMIQDVINTHDRYGIILVKNPSPSQTQKQ